MTTARDRLAIAEITAALTGSFDLPTVLDAVAHDACTGFAAASVVVLLRDGRGAAAEMQVVAEALRVPTDADLGFVTDGPGLVTAREGAIAMIDDLDDSTTAARWPRYRHDARRAGVRGVRAFPVSVLDVPMGALVVHTAEPWGIDRPNEFGQVLANLAAIAVSIAPQAEQRRTDTSATIDTLLQGTAAIATATGILAELSGVDAREARLQLRRLARAHASTVTGYAHALVEAHDRDPENVGRSDLLRPPPDLQPPRHIDEPSES